MKRTKGIIIAFASLVGSTLFLTSATFAWFSFNSNLNHTVQVDSSSLSISDLSTNVFKYVYPHYTDASGSVTPYINYFDAGTIAKNPVSQDLNLFDPTFLVIANRKNQAGISFLNTNLVLEVSFTIHYTTPVDLEIYAKKNANYTPSSGHFGVSRFLRFNVFSEAEKTTEAAHDSYSSDTADEKCFYSIKNLSETSSTHSSFLGASDCSIYSAEVISTQPVEESSLTFTYYMNVDYDFALTSSTDNEGLDFFDDEHIGNSYVLDMDYGFFLKAKEHLSV